MAEENKKFRDMVADEFVKALQGNPLEWKKQWSLVGTGRPYNPTKGTPYKGVNFLWLKMVEEENNFGDPRWMSFKQASALGYKIKAGSKGTKVEYWMPVNNQTKKAVTWDEYNKARKNNGGKEPTYKEDGIDKKLFSIRAKYFTVFNGSQIEGIKPFEVDRTRNDIKPSEIVNMVAKGMNVPIIEDKNGNRAYYSPQADNIHLPEKERFNSDIAYQSVAMHELGHATGHESRLNRNQTGRFGTKDYAFEELIAETTATFMSEYFTVEMSEEELKNHAAYIQSWSEEIKKDKNYLFKAINQAEEAADYMIEKGGLNKSISINYEKVRERANERTEEERIISETRFSTAALYAQNDGDFAEKHDEYLQKIDSKAQVKENELMFMNIDNLFGTPYTIAYINHGIDSGGVESVIYENRNDSLRKIGDVQRWGSLTEMMRYYELIDKNVELPHVQHFPEELSRNTSEKSTKEFMEDQMPSIENFVEEQENIFGDKVAENQINYNGIMR